MGNKYSNDDVDKKIKTILSEMKKNSALVALVPEAKKDASKKVINKIKEYFE